MRYLYFTILLSVLLSCKDQEQNYQCPPCNLPCDELVFDKSGKCPHCKMALQKRSSELTLNKVEISEGSGSFLIEGGKGNKEKPIRVFYHKPKTFSADSKIVLVIPGAGRNGDSYRDAWKSEAEKYGFLVVSLNYPEDNYPFEAYHLCGIIKDIGIEKGIEYVANSNIVKVKEDTIDFGKFTKEEDWIFNDFDRVFDLVVKATQSNQKKYEIFGHSAGGQILHRFALFGKSEKANKILASNSGFYTFVDFSTNFPFGLKNTELSTKDLETIYKKKLILVIGELDNENETRGTLLRSVTVDHQGLHRLERAKNFFESANAVSLERKLELNWKLVIVPEVGHDHKKITETAAKLIYDGK